MRKEKMIEIIKTIGAILLGIAVVVAFTLATALLLCLSEFGTVCFQPGFFPEYLREFLVAFCY
jgi:hypothetical protein